MPEGLNLQEGLVPALGEEQRRLGALVQRGAVTDQTKSIYGKALLSGAKDKASAPHLVDRHSTILKDEPAYFDPIFDHWFQGDPSSNVSLAAAR